MVSESTLEQIYIIKIIEKNYEFNKDIHLVLLDSNFQYNSVNLEKSWSEMDDNMWLLRKRSSKTATER